MSSTPRAGEKRPSDGPNDGDSDVPVKIEALGPAAPSSSSAASRNSLPEPAGDVTSLHTKAEMEARLEQKEKQCAKQYDARILELESSHASEKAQWLAKAVQANQRHEEETARLSAEIESLQAKLEAMHEAAASVKKEAMDLVDEQAIRQEMEQRFAEERLLMEQRFDDKRQQMEQRFVEEKEEIERSSVDAKQKADQEIATLKEHLAESHQLKQRLVEEKQEIERESAEAKQKADQEINSMKELLASQSESIATLTNNIHELSARATKAESEKTEAQQRIWQYYAHAEALQKEVEVLRAASESFTPPPPPNATTAPADFTAPPAQNVTTATPSANQIYVGKLTPAMGEDVLRQYFSQLGHVARVVIRRHPDLSGYAFVHFATPAEALHALSCTAHSINGQDICVGPIRR